MLTSDRASATRCCWPPESWLGRRLANSGSFTRSSISSERLRASAAGTFFERRPNATFSTIDMCGNRAYCWNTVFTFRLYGGTDDTSVPSSRIAPVGRRLEAGDHLQDRRLAAPGRPEQGEELAAPDAEAGVLHGGEVAEALREVIEHDHIAIGASTLCIRHRCDRLPR